MSFILHKKTIGLVMALVMCGLSVFILPSEKGDAQVKISYWHGWGGHYGKLQQELVDAFNKTHPEIKVEALIVPSGEILAKMLSGIAGGNPPDVVCPWLVVDYDFTLIMYEPLDEFMRENEELMGPQSWLPGQLDAGKAEGKQYGLPFCGQNLFLVYNVDMFKDAGLDPENPPKYWKDLEIASEKLTKKDAREEYRIMGFLPIGYNDIGPNFISERVVYWSYRNNARWWDPETRKMTVTDPKNIETWEWLSSWYKKYGVDKIARWDASVSALATSPFAAGHVAMIEDGPWSIPYLEEYAPDLDYDAMVMPYPESGRPVTPAFCAPNYIMKGTKHLQEAWVFLSWLVTEGASIWSPEIGEAPARYDVANLPAWENMPRYDLFKKMLTFVEEYGEGSLPGFPKRSVFARECSTYFERVIRLKMTPQEALEELQVVTQKALDEYYKK